MGKKAAAAAAIILIAAGVYIFSQQIGQSQRGDSRRAAIVPSTADWIPAAAGTADYTLMRVDDTASLSYALSVASSLIGLAGGGLSSALPPGISPDDVSGVTGYLDAIKGFIDASSAVTFYATSSDDLYVSMFVDDSKFDWLVKSGDGRQVRVDEWAARPGDAWLLSPADASGDHAAYMVRARAGDKSVVNISNSEKNLDAMTQAAADPSKRLKPEQRKTDEPNFIRMKLASPVAVPDMDGAKVGETETSWSRSDEKISIRCFSDMFSGAAEKIISRDFAPKSPPLLGDGEPALLASFDPALFLYAIHPGEDDPVKAYMSRYGRGIPQQFAGDLEAILRRCRLSAAIVASGDVISTAYLAFESAEESAVENMYGLAAMLLGKKELEGWDHAASVPTGRPAGALIARRGGVVIFGAGDFDQYLRETKVPGDLEKIVSGSGVFGVMAAPGRLTSAKGSVAGLLAEGAASFLSAGVPGLPDFGEILRTSRVENFTVTQTMDGRTDIDIFLRK